MRAVANRWSHVLRAHLAATLFIALLSTACYEWHTESMAPASVLATRQPAMLRVIRTDGSQVVLQRPRLQGDTLVGIGYPEVEHEVRVALSDVKQVATGNFSMGRTLGLGVGVAAGVLAAVAALVFSNPVR